MLGNISMKTSMLLSIQNMYQNSMVNCQMIQGHILYKVFTANMIRPIAWPYSKAIVFWQLRNKTLKDLLSPEGCWTMYVNMQLIPQVMNAFINLSILDISHNNITWLPHDLCHLRHLQVFIVNDNSLAALPEHIGHLYMLKELKACSNQLVTLPESMKLLTNLSYLGLYNNDFKSMDSVILSIPNLMGLDLEQNYFSTNMLLIRDIHYECLKTSIRHHWSCDSIRLDGPKANIWRDEDNNSNWSLSDCQSSFSENMILPDNNFENSTEENWDVSEDSADEFDPNEYVVPKKRTRSPFMLYNILEPVFCPADIHQKRCIDQVRAMIQQGTLSISSQIVEGQFEDAEA